jgi:hypothetical protein
LLLGVRHFHLSFQISHPSFLSIVPLSILVYYSHPLVNLSLIVFLFTAFLTSLLTAHTKRRKEKSRMKAKLVHHQPRRPVQSQTPHTTMMVQGVVSMVTTSVQMTTESSPTVPVPMVEPAQAQTVEDQAQTTMPYGQTKQTELEMYIPLRRNIG